MLLMTSLKVTIGNGSVQFESVKTEPLNFLKLELNPTEPQNC